MSFSLKGGVNLQRPVVSPPQLRTVPQLLSETGASNGVAVQQSILLSPRFETIPPLLAETPQWIVWKCGDEKPGGRFEKIPVHPKTLRTHNAFNSAIWMSLDEAQRVYEKGEVAGIGFVLNGEPISRDDDGNPVFLVGIDIDGCVSLRDGKPEPNAEVKQVRMRLGRPYLELSPSGTGVRIFTLSTQLLPSGNRGGREMYRNKRWLTVTGMGSGEIKLVGQPLVDLHNEWFGKRPNLAINDELTGGLQTYKRSLEETPENIEYVRGLLSYIDPDPEPSGNYERWRNIVWALASLEWE